MPEDKATKPFLQQDISCTGCLALFFIVIGIPLFFTSIVPGLLCFILAAILVAASKK